MEKGSRYQGESLLLCVGGPLVRYVAGRWRRIRGTPALGGLSPDFGSAGLDRDPCFP